MTTKAKSQLNRLIDSIQRTELDMLEQQRKQLAAYVKDHEADVQEDADIAAVIRILENYFSSKTETYIATMNSIGKILTGRDAVEEYVKENNLQCVECADSTSHKAAKEVPIWKKYTLSVDEAALYFRIGKDKLRKLLNEKPDADFVLWNGTRAQIKRRKFEEYIDLINVI